jgi:glutathionylspermidine amidase/synthetase
MYKISPKSEAELLKATFELHNMALEAVDKVVNDDKLMAMFNLNKVLWPAIKKSWKDR